MFRHFLLPVAATFAANVAAAATVPQCPSGVPVAPAASAPCPQFYLDRRAPAPAVLPAAGEEIFCHSFFAANYSSPLRDPIWTSYLLTRAMVRGADGFKRRDRTFGPQAGLDPGQQARDSDYTHTGFARGHMTPADDAATCAEQADTFVVTNIVPQVGPFNSGRWAQLERAVHRLAASEHEVYIVTGPMFEEARPPINGIAVPSSIFKAIYVPSRRFALAFIATNENPTSCRIVPIAELQRRIGLDPFPSLPAATKAHLPALPRGWGRFPTQCTVGP